MSDDETTARQRVDRTIAACERGGDFFTIGSPRAFAEDVRAVLNAATPPWT